MAKSKKNRKEITVDFPGYMGNTISVYQFMNHISTTELNGHPDGWIVMRDNTELIPSDDLKRGEKVVLVKK